MTLPVVNIAIVEDHPIVRDALGQLLSTKKSLRVAGTAGNLKEAFAVLERIQPDLVLADLSLGDGSAIELVRRGKREHPGTQFLIMTAFCNEFSATEAFDAGATGFILKRQSTADLFAAIERVTAGGVYLSPLLELPTRRRTLRAAGEKPLGRLSKREHEIFHLVVTGGDTREIAGRLRISVKTVETHRTSINRKLGITSTASLLRFAVAHGIEINPAAGAA
ncbi:MAG TPA: response regulator transcription factor [Polyangia bacterium]